MIYTIKSATNKFIYLFLLFFLMSPLNVYSKEKLLIVTEPWPPYSIGENGRITGIDFDMAKAVLEKMGYEVIDKIYPWQRAQQIVREKQADALLDCIKNEERLSFLIYPEEPLSKIASHIFYKKGHKFKYENINSLKGLNVGILTGYKYGKVFDQSTIFQKQSVEKNESNFKKLLAGRIDVVIDNPWSGFYTIKQLGFGDQIEISEIPVVAAEPIYIGFAKKQGYTILAEQFSKNLKEFKKTDTYKKILEKYARDILPSTYTVYETTPQLAPPFPSK